MIIKYISRSQPYLDCHRVLSCSDQNCMQSMAWVWRSEKPHQVCHSAQCCEGEWCCEDRGTHGDFGVVLCMNGRVVSWQTDQISVQTGAEVCQEVVRGV